MEFERGEAGDEGGVAGRFGKMLERVEDSSDATFSDVGVDARPFAEAVNAEVERGHCGLSGGEEGCVISIPYAGDSVGGSDGVADFVMLNPSVDGLSAEVEEEGG